MLDNYMALGQDPAGFMIGELSAAVRPGFPVLLLSHCYFAVLALFLALLFLSRVRIFPALLERKHCIFIVIYNEPPWSGWSARWPARTPLALPLHKAKLCNDNDTAEDFGFYKLKRELQ
jgi:hypothetical protein